MAFENTLTEHNMDPKAQKFVNGLRGDAFDIEPDLSVDGLSESILSRIFGLFGRRRS